MYDQIKRLCLFMIIISLSRPIPLNKELVCFFMLDLLIDRSVLSQKAWDFLLYIDKLTFVSYNGAN